MGDQAFSAAADQPRGAAGLPWGRLISPERMPLLEKLVFFVYVLLLPLLFASETGIFRDGDVDWHVAAGQWILANGRVPHTDPFSFSMAGQPWVAHEWLAEVVYALAFDLAGYAGLAAVVAAALMALNLVIFLHLRTRIGPIAMVVVLVAINVALAKFTLARPHVLVWPVLAMWTAVLLSSRDRDRPPPLWLAALMLVWVNLHGSFLLGFIIAAFIGAGAMLRSRFDRRLLIGWAVFGLVSLAAAFVNASGLSAFTHPLMITGMEALATIGEWRPSRPDADPIFYAFLIVTIGVFMVSGRKMQLPDAVLLLIMLLMAFTHVRHQTWLLIVASMIVPPLFSGFRKAGPLFPQASRFGWIAGAVLLGGSVIALRAAMPIEPEDQRHNPRGLIASIPAELRDKPVFNEYSFGGRLILAGIRPYIDGRADMYGDPFVQRYSDIVKGDMKLFEEDVAKYGIRWTILPNSATLVKELDASPEWRRVRSDSIGVIHVREQPKTAAN